METEGKEGTESKKGQDVLEKKKTEENKFQL